MAKFTKSIRFALTPELLEKTRTAAQQQGDSISGLIRTALEKYFKATSRLDIPLVHELPLKKSMPTRFCKSILMKTVTIQQDTTGRIEK